MLHNYGLGRHPAKAEFNMSPLINYQIVLISKRFFLHINIIL